MAAISDPRATDRQSPNHERLFRYLEKLSKSGFYGKVTVSFQHGKVCDIRTEQSHKLEDL
jgi:hypothetical protein